MNASYIQEDHRHRLDQEGFHVLLPLYLEWLSVKNYCASTVAQRDKYLRYFFVWCAARNLTKGTEITRPILERYGRWLYHYQKANGRPLSVASRRLHLVAVQQFFRWLVKSNRLLANPAADLELPRKEQRLPKYVLSVSEVERVLAQIPLSDPLGIRDRAILETLYSTGMRRMELMMLGVQDVDVDRGTVMIRQGKGKKDRMIPIGDRASAWIEKYRNEVRPLWVSGADEGVLFVTHHGERFTLDRLSQLVRRYVDRAELGKRGSCHMFRHTCATLMLEHGADVRYIQQMLGHRDLSSTQVYTQVSIKKLKAIHTATHPGAMSGVRITGYGLRGTDYGVRITGYGLRDTDYGIRIKRSSILTSPLNPLIRNPYPVIQESLSRYRGSEDILWLCFLIALLRCWPVWTQRPSSSGRSVRTVPLADNPLQPYIHPVPGYAISPRLSNPSSAWPYLIFTSFNPSIRTPDLGSPLGADGSGGRQGFASGVPRRVCGGSAANGILPPKPHSINCGKRVLPLWEFLNWRGVPGRGIPKGEGSAGGGPAHRLPCRPERGGRGSHDAGGFAG